MSAAEEAERIALEAVRSQERAEEHRKANEEAQKRKQKR